jgi:hypothetical protein
MTVMPAGRTTRAAQPVTVAHLMTAISAVLTGVGFFLPWVKASVSGVDFGTLHSGGLSNTGSAFAKEFPHTWPILAMVAAAGLIGVALLLPLGKRSVWVAVAAVAVGACTLAAYLTDKGRFFETRQTSGIGFSAVFHVGFTWGFYLTAVLAGVTLALALVGLADR